MVKLCLWSSFALFFTVGTGIVAAGLLKYLERPLYYSSDHIAWKKNNAIILLGSGTVSLPSTSEVKPSISSYSRIWKGASLYSMCKKTNNVCTIILSGGDTLKTGKSEAQTFKEELLDIGIRAQDIITESASLNTYKNAQMTSNIVKLQQFDNIFLVTSGIHIKRAQLYFSSFGVHTIPISADYLAPTLSFIPLGSNFAITDFALHEYIGIVRFYVYNYFGWNVRTSK